jgi:hypothetical protein
MSLIDQLSTLRSNLPADPPAFEHARARRPALAPFGSPREIVSALEAISPLPLRDRYAIVAAIVLEHQEAPRPIWASVLLVAFAPMLLDLRKRLGRDEDEDRDQNVLAAFLEAMKGIRVGTAAEFATAALQRRTWRGAISQRRADRVEDEHDAFDEESHTEVGHDPFGISAAEARIEVAWAKRREERVRAEEAKLLPMPKRRRRAA